MSFILVLGIALWVALAFWPAVMAKKKGYSFIVFLLIAWVISWLLSLVIVLFLKDKNETPESIAASKAADAVLAKEENR